ncbi:uncharacterized protein LOC125077942 [Vanessa atalanta]|uniref:uncharacterized protein LOC125077942 n=1 Tax=Vanessa atalanta TaxID=42275 RepID=UPI001FCCF1A9|nr:uncharacterized protein LOC125077942 [Vanessa atalanta]
MSSDNYQIQNILSYTRKSYKSRNGMSLEAFTSARTEDVNEELLESPRSDRVTADTASCSCDLDTEVEIANILHKKCPVIALAQQQLQRLLDETDKLLCDNTRCCRSIYDYFLLGKEVLWNQNKCQCTLIIMIIFTFIVGLILGAASCGTNLRKFNSPLLTCIDNYFIPETYSAHDDLFSAIV